MLSTVLRTHCARSALSNAAFRNASPTVSSLVASRSFLTTAQALKDKAEKAGKAAKATKATVGTAQKVKSKAIASKVPKKDKEEVLKALAQKKAKALQEKEREKAKAKALKEKEKAKLIKQKALGKKATEKQKAKEKKEKERVALKKSRPPFKKPMNAYMKFMSTHLANPGGPGLADRNEVVRKAAKIWGGMSEAEKQEYAVDPKEYEEYIVKYKEWKASLTPKERSLRKFTRIAYHPYNLYVKEHFPKTLEEGTTFAEVSRNLRNQYTALSAEEKEDYVKRAAAITAARREAAEKAAAATAAEKAAKKAAKEAAATLARNVEA